MGLPLSYLGPPRACTRCDDVVVEERVNVASAQVTARWPEFFQMNLATFVMTNSIIFFFAQSDPLI